MGPAPNYEWDRKSDVATLDGEPVPGRAHANEGGWAIEVLCETGLVLYIVGHEEQDPEATGYAVLIAAIDCPDGTPSPREEGIASNSVACRLRTSDGVLVDEGVGGDIVAVEYDHECLGALFCDPGRMCDHDWPRWGDVIPTMTALRRVIAVIGTLPVRTASPARRS